LFVLHGSADATIVSISKPLALRQGDCVRLKMYMGAVCDDTVNCCDLTFALLART
jgi:hypothetical protein